MQPHEIEIQTFSAKIYIFFRTLSLIYGETDTIIERYTQRAYHNTDSFGVGTLRVIRYTLWEGNDGLEQS